MPEQNARPAPRTTTTQTASSRAAASAASASSAESARSSALSTRGRDSVIVRDAVAGLVGHPRLAHGWLRAPRISRAMTMRCTSEVPSPISVSLASRKMRSMGNSVM